MYEPILLLIMFIGGVICGAALTYRIARSEVEALGRQLAALRTLYLHHSPAAAHHRDCMCSACCDTAIKSGGIR